MWDQALLRESDGADDFSAPIASDDDDNRGADGCSHDRGTDERTHAHADGTDVRSDAEPDRADAIPYELSDPCANPVGRQRRLRRAKRYAEHSGGHDRFHLRGGCAILPLLRERQGVFGPGGRL
jgi:hypothetical protein